MPGLKQGPWTDVYALAAVVHWIIMGKTPPPSVGRLFDDPYVPLAQSAAGRYSDAFLRAIDHALAVMPEKRTASIEAMRIELFGDALPASAPIAGAAAAGTAAQDVPRSQPHPRTETLRHDPTLQMVPPTEQGVRTEAAPAAPTQASSSKMPLVAGGIGLVVVAGLAAFALWPKSTPPGPTTTTPVIAAPAVTAAPAASLTTGSGPMPVVATPRVDTPVVISPAASAVPATVTTAPTTSPPRDAPRPTEPSAVADPKPVVRKPPPPRETPAQPSERPDAPVQARPAEPKQTDNSAECARIFQQISLGQADQATMDRLRVLRCR